MAKHVRTEIHVDERYKIAHVDALKLQDAVKAINASNKVLVRDVCKALEAAY